MTFIRCILLAFILIQCSCIKDQEHESRRAIRALLISRPINLDKRLNRIKELGTYVLPDIEQAFHETPVAGRLRLLKAIHVINSKKSLPLLDFLSKWDTEEEVRVAAKKLAKRIRSK